MLGNRLVLLRGVVATLTYAHSSSSEKGQLWQEALKALSQLMLGSVSWLMCVPAHLVWWWEEFVPGNLLWQSGNMPFSCQSVWLACVGKPLSSQRQIMH